MMKRAGLEPTLIRHLVDSVFRFSLLLFGLVMAAGQLGINVGAALAGIGVAGLAIGFAAQDSLSNTIAGFLIFWDKPFLVGDWVEVADEYGRVDEITLRTTRIQTNNNTYVVIPNQRIIDEVLVNHSKHGSTRVEVPVGIAYKEFVPDARKVILDAVCDLEWVDREPAPAVVVQELASSGVSLLVRVWITDVSKEKPIYNRVLEASKLALDDAGIQIPYPHLQLFLDRVEPEVWDGLAEAAQRARGANGAL
jgi:small conductance mechanosensitive channel